MSWFKSMFIAGAVAAAALTAPQVAVAQTGAIRGQVTEQDTGQPVQDARVVVVGTNLAAVSARDGTYQLINVPAGAVTIRVAVIGFGSQTRTLNVASGQTATSNFALTRAAITLDAVVVTATGERRQRELGNSIPSIRADETVREVAPTSIANLIQGRAAGVQILNSSGTAGSGTKIRIRGSSSISLSNEPLLVVDGVRVDNRESDLGFGVGGQVVSRMNDFNPDDIESIEIVKGPSAATLYGTEAANGVIVITTKKGRVGKPVWNAYVEQGVVTEIADYPFNYRGLTATGGSCRLINIAAGTCTQAELQRANPLESPNTSPFRTGRRQQFGVNVAGGSQDVRYYISGEWETELGVYGLPKPVTDSILGTGAEIPDFASAPNNLERASFRANLNAQLNDRLNLNVSTGYVTADIRLPQNDNNVLGMLPSGYLGLADSTVNGGYGFFRPEEIFFIDATQGIERYTNSANLTWRPTEWLEGRANVGLDYAGRSDIEFQATGTGPDFATRRQGDRVSDKTSTYQYTVDLGATAQFQLTDRITSKTSVGFQYYRNNRTEVETEGEVLAPGAGSQKAASNQFIDENFVESKTVGTFIEQQIGLDDRLFVTGAIRGDDNSAFGQDFNVIIYPKVGVSYLLLEDRAGAINNFRLRGAWGASGQQPGTNDAVKFFQGIAFAEGGNELSGVTIGGAGNNLLKPERSTELEFGFESGLFDGRAGLDFTYYRRVTKDALISRQLAPSLGLTDDRFENIGETLNFGFEGGIRGTPIQTSGVTWDVSLIGSTNTNRIVELGEGVSDIIFGPQRHQEGFPLGAYFENAFTYQDANSDGIIDLSEISFDLDGDGQVDEPVFFGYPRPRYEVSLHNSITLGNRFRLSGLFDYRGGHLMNNFTEAFRCRFNICRGLNDIEASLEEQARAQTQRSAVQTLAGYLEPGWFIKLRELSFTFLAPDSWARAIRASRLNLTVTGRNLLTITDYTGLDPEIQGSTGNFTSRDFLTQPQVRYWIARLQVTF